MITRHFFKYPFAVSGLVTPIDETIQPDGTMSYQAGFTIDYTKVYGTDPNAKAMPIDKTNQLFLDISQAIQQLQVWGVPNFITAADNGGSAYSYSKYARCLFDNGSGPQEFISLVNSNTATPADATKWRLVDNTTPDNPIGSYLDYAGFSAPPKYLLCDGSPISRTTYADLFAVITFAQNGTLTSGANTVSGLTSTANMFVGMRVTGINIPANTTVASIVDANNITISNNATGSGASSITFYPFGAGDESTTFNLPDARGRGRLGAGQGASLTNRINGQTGGEEQHTQTIAEMPAHNHPPPSSATAFLAETTTAPTTTANAGGTDAYYGTTGDTGGGNPFNVLDPFIVCTTYIRYAA